MLQNIALYWYWLVLTGIFLAVEALIVPLGLFLCLGSAAGVVALLTFLFPGLGWLWSLSIFAVLLVCSSWLWWKVLRKKSNNQDSALNVKTRQLLGYRGVLEEDIKGGRGRLRVNDSSWPVTADTDFPAGTKVVVTGVNGTILSIREAD